MILPRLLISIGVLFACASLRAQVKPAPVFGDHMVLQREMKVPVWGKAGAGESVTVTFQDQKISTRADARGRWRVDLHPMPASAQPAELTIAGKTPVTILDVLVGEVWLCSGQSNMAWTVRENGVSVKNAAEEQAAANFPLIRHLRVPKSNANEPSDTFVAPWQVCSPDTVGSFSGVAYFFGRDLFQKLNVPIGLINASYGGTPVEAWLSAETMKSSPACEPAAARMQKTAADWPQIMTAYRSAADKWKMESEAAKATGSKLDKPQPRQPVGPGHPYSPVTVYNAMLHPLIPTAIRGVIWYQGEANVAHADEYHGLLTALIEQWRKEWDEGGFPFYFVQLANFKGADPDIPDWAWLRDAQTQTLSVPNTGMAVAIDVGDPNSIHPTNKQSIGQRLAWLAMNKTYGMGAVEYSGPVYDHCEADGNVMRIHFKNARGLTSGTGEFTGFEIAGADQAFVPAAALLEKETIVVLSPAVPKPVAVRYAWANSPAFSLFNAAGLPAAPFRTDDWPQPKPSSAAP